MWNNRNIMITGGSGSLGLALSRHILAHRPHRLVLYSRGEHRQQFVAEELGNDPALRMFIGDVRDLKRLIMAMQGIEIVIHAAALKVIPAIEYNPIEAVETNVRGTQNVIYAALATGVSLVVNVGSDKQVNPINTYGATKLLAEKLMVGANNLSAGRARFCGVRYGNVAGSNGSVIPYWKQLAREGKPLPMTSVEMTRFSITMDEAVNLIEYAVERAEGREVFIRKLPSYQLFDLANVILSRSASDRSGTGIKIVGARPGEKMHETLMTAEEHAAAGTDNGTYTLRGDKVKAVGMEGKPYSSDTNTWWLNATALKELVDAC